MTIPERLKWLGELRLFVHPSQMKDEPEPEPDPNVVRHQGENDAKEQALFASGAVPQAERPHPDHVAMNAVLSLFGHREPADQPPTPTPQPVQEPHMSFLSSLVKGFTAVEGWFVKEAKAVFSSDEAKAIEAGLVAFAKSKFGVLALDAVEFVSSSALTDTAARDAAVAKLKADATAAGIEGKTLATSDYNWAIETATTILKKGISTVSTAPTPAPTV